MRKIFKNIKKKLVKAAATALVAITAFSSTAQGNMITAQAASASVIYKVHGANYGWQGEKSNGALAGTEGQSLQLECMTAYIKGMSGGIKYRVHGQNYGWSAWTSDNRPAGTTGEGLRLEAFEMKLYGDVANYYDVEYRAHCQNLGWTAWKRSGACGTTGQSLRMEAIQIRLVAKSNTSNNGGSSSSTLDFASLQAQYPTNSKWTSSYKEKAWTCHGFACLLGDKLTGTDPYTWTKKYSLNSLKAGDIIRFSRPHTIMVTAVNGNTITYVDCNWVATNTVCWNQTITKSGLSKFGTFQYVMSCPK